MRVLVIEDDKNLGKIVKKGLEENAFVVDLCPDGEEGLYMAETYPYDAVILDVLLPGMDGFTILKSLRDKKIDVPVVMLTAKVEVEDKIKGLNIGADDYISKPFDFTELIARVRAVMRRTKGVTSSVITVGDLVIDTNTRTANRAGRVVKLSSKEYNLLEYLAFNKGRVVSRSEIIEHLYDTEFDLDSNVIDVYVNFLRNKIDKGFDKHILQTVRGAGYILKED